MSLSDKLLKVAKKSNKDSSVLSKSKILDKESQFKLDVPMLNVALSGHIDKGPNSGILQIVGDSRCFKTCYGLIMVKAYLDKNPEGNAVFFDSEQGAAFEYFDTFGIDKDRVIHCPIANVEDMKIQAAQMLEEIDKGDKVIFFVDSIGLLPSKKEAVDAAEGKEVADMTRARALNSFWRVVTNPIGLKDLFIVVINHYYDTIGGMYPEKVIKGGKGGFLASNDIWIVTRSKIKDGTDLAGWSFNIGIMKSRKVKENARIPIEVLYDGGINKYSGILEVARATGHVESPSKGWYSRTFIEDDKKWRKAEMDNDFFKSIVENEDFKKAVNKMYSLSSGNMFDEKKIEEVLEDEGIECDPETGEILNKD